MQSTVILFSILALGSSRELGRFIPDGNCGENEEMGWVSGCDPPYTCPSNSDLIVCKPMPSMPACVCKKGYYRNFLGECISAEQCNQCQKPHEFYTCNSACDNECKDIKTQNRTNCPIKSKVCIKRCYCEDGYARDGKGDCIPVDKCETTCDSNEEYVFGKSCPPDLCNSLEAKYKCDSQEEDKPRCRCKPGHQRVTENSPCVPICQCPEKKYSDDCPFVWAS